MYWNQSFKSIKDHLSPNNVFQLYSVAYTLRIKKLIEDLDHFIVNELLDRENWINFYLDGIKFKSDKITNAWEKVLIRDFQDICSAKDGQYFLNQLPLTYFINLMKGDELNVDTEAKVLECVEKYIRHRTNIVHDKTPEEKAHEAEERARQGLPPIPDLEAEEEIKKQERFNGLDDAGKIQFLKTDEVDKLRKEAEERMRVRGLRSSDKRELYKTIRYAFISHAELLKWSRDPLFNEAKEYLVEGLTYKIDPEEVLGKDETIISLKPRLHYLVEDEYTRLNIKRPQHHRLDEKGYPIEDSKRSYESKTKTRHGADHSSKSIPKTAKPNQIPAWKNQAREYDKNQLSYPARNIATSGMDDTFTRAEPLDHTSVPPIAPMKFGVGYNKSNKIVPQTNWTMKKPLVTSFDYSYDFDENGLFYFLGTEGGRKNMAKSSFYWPSTSIC